MARERLIRASEIGEYVYCHRAWWLHQVQGVEPSGRARREHGTALHAAHGRRVWASQALLVAGILLLLAALIAFWLR
jgi:CRISPR/Cas system-associated exonuclease Cas4 (RecB family)